MVVEIAEAGKVKVVLSKNRSAVYCGQTGIVALLTVRYI
jgi:hypothetical protein